MDVASDAEPLEATGWIAIYAAAVSTGSLGWQVWNSYRARRPQVSVYLETWRTSEEPGQRLLEDARIQIRNREEYAVRVDRIYFRYPKGRMSRYGTPAVVDGGELPVDVPARETIPLSIRPDGEYLFPPAKEAGAFFPGVSVVLRTASSTRVGAGRCCDCLAHEVTGDADVGQGRGVVGIDTSGVLTG